MAETQAEWEPKPNDVLRIEAGSSTALSFSVVNDSPQVVRFQAAATGHDWLRPEAELRVGPRGKGNVRLIAAPEAGIAPGRFAITVEILWDGSPDQEIPLVLEIVPPAAPVAQGTPAVPAPSADAAPTAAAASQGAPVPVVPSVNSLPPAAEPITTKEAGAAPTGSALEREREMAAQAHLTRQREQAEREQSELQARQEAEARERERQEEMRERERQTEAQERERQNAIRERERLERLAREEAEAKQRADEEARRIEAEQQERARQERERRQRDEQEAQQREIEAAERQKQEDERKQREVERAAQAKAAEAAETATVDYGAQWGSAGGTDTPGGTAEMAAEAEGMAFTEPVARDPQDNAAFSLLPGETQIVAYSFKNDRPPARERGYVVDIDDNLRRDSAKRAWVELVRSEVNVSHGQSGELYIRFRVPQDASPGEYDFTLLVGPREGPLLPRRLTLSVRAVPAVRLQTKSLKISDGPFSRKAVTFPLEVVSGGNCDTAFRIAAVNPEVNADLSGPGGGTIYEAPQWRYLFDQELENLRSPGYGRIPAPVPVTLQVERKGIWWLGWRDSHALTVRAFPVTDEKNANQSGNELNLVATRWRLTPIPEIWFIVLLLCLIPLFGVAPGNLQVSNAVYTQPDNQVAYVVGDPDDSGKKVTAKLHWSPFLIPVSLFVDDKPQGRFLWGSGDADEAYGGGARVTSRQVRVANNVSGRGDSMKIVYFMSRPDTPLTFDSSKPAALTSSDGTHIALKVPKSGYISLLLGNQAKDRYQLTYKVAARPVNYTCIGLDDKTIEGHANDVKEIQIKRNKPDVSAEEIILVTTDKATPVLHIKLQPE